MCLHECAAQAVAELVVKRLRKFNVISSQVADSSICSLFVFMSMIVMFLCDKFICGVFCDLPTMLSSFYYNSFGYVNISLFPLSSEPVGNNVCSY